MQKEIQKNNEKIRMTQVQYDEKVQKLAELQLQRHDHLKGIRLHASDRLAEELAYQIHHAEIVSDELCTDRIGLGDLVEIELIEDSEAETMLLFLAEEKTTIPAVPGATTVSITSKIANSIYGKSVGEECHLLNDSSILVRILSHVSKSQLVLIGDIVKGKLTKPDGSYEAVLIRLTSGTEEPVAGMMDINFNSLDGKQLYGSRVGGMIPLSIGQLIISEKESLEADLQSENVKTRNLIVGD